MKGGWYTTSEYMGAPTIFHTVRQLSDHPSVCRIGDFMWNTVHVILNHPKMYQEHLFGVQCHTFASYSRMQTLETVMIAATYCMKRCYPLLLLNSSAFASFYPTIHHIEYRK